MNLFFRSFFALIFTSIFTVHSFCQSLPTVAVPLFVNRTAGQTTTVAPGDYKEGNVRIGSDSRSELYWENGKLIRNQRERGAYDKQLERQIRYAPGEWILPEAAGEIAAAATTDAFVRSKTFRMLSRMSPELREWERRRESEEMPSKQIFASLNQANSSYLLLGSILRYRVDETKGTVYGVQRRQVATSVSLHLQLVNVQSAEIIISKSLKETVYTNIPDGITEMTSVYDWEKVLSTAVNKGIDTFIKEFAEGTRSQRSAPAEGFIEVYVNSKPTGAVVEFDGDYVATTPCTVALPARRGVLRIYTPTGEWKGSIVPAQGMKIEPTLSDAK